MNIYKKKKIISAFLLSSFLDTIGFNNGNWEFNWNQKISSLEKALYYQHIYFYQFFINGGFSKYSIKKKKASDDTILMLATTKALIKGGKKKDFIKEYIKILPELKKLERGAGYATLSGIINWKKLNKDVAYHMSLGGNGAAIRTGPIGLYYNKEKNIDKLIKCALDASIITHNYIIGYLGGLTVAYFASLAYRNIEPWKWVKLLLDLEKSGKIEMYFKDKKKLKQYNKDKYIFWDKWKEYQESRLSRFTNQYNFVMPDYRLKYISKNFSPQIFSNDEEHWEQLGSSGLDSIIWALDSIILSLQPLPNKILDLENSKTYTWNWETLLTTSTLHAGDNDSTGAIAGFLWGSFIGEYKITLDQENDLEFIKELKKYSNLMINKIE